MGNILRSERNEKMLSSKKTEIENDKYIKNIRRLL